MNTIRTVFAAVAVLASVSGCSLFKMPPEPKPEDGTYENWGKVNGRQVFIVWHDGKAYTENEAKRKGFAWNPPIEENAKKEEEK